MTILPFSHDDLSKKLSLLPKRLRTAFAAACAQRLMPAYTGSASRNLNANPQQATKILTELWNDIQSGCSDPGKLKGDVERCETLIPDHDGKYFEGFEHADNAMCSLAYAVESELKGGVEEAAWAARRSFESLFHAVKNTFGDGRSPAEMDRIRSLPLMQAELRRQQADLADLQLAAKNPGSEPASLRGSGGARKPIRNSSFDCRD